MGTRVAYLRSVTTDPDVAGVLRAWDSAMELGGLSKRTRASYRYEFIRFYVDHLSLSGDSLEAISASNLAAYLVSLPANGSKRGDQIRALKSFFAWSIGKLRDDDPTVNMRVKRVPSPRAPDLTDGEVRRLVRAAFHRDPRRGWSIVLCLATGARIGSLVAARPEDVKDGVIWFREAKGDKPYEVPLSRLGQSACDHLGAMASLRGTLVGVSGASFRNWVHDAGRDAGIEQRVWPHLLRHVTLTRVARQTDPATVADIANWSDLSQYRRYVAVDEGRKRAALNAVL